MLESKQDIACYHEHLRQQLAQRPAARVAYLLAGYGYKANNYERDELAICIRIAQQAVINRTK